MRKLLIASQKGGVGKTTTCVQLGLAARRAGKRVLLVDTDPIGCVRAAVSAEASAGSFRSANETIEALPGGLELLEVPDHEFEGRPVSTAIEELIRERGRQGEFDVVLVDSQPYTGERSLAVLSSCPEMLLVMRAEPMAYRSLPPFLKVLSMLSYQGSAPKLHGILLTAPPGQEGVTEWEKAMRQHFGDRIVGPSIPWDPTLRQELLVGAGNMVNSPIRTTSPAAEQYDALAAQLDLAN